MPKNGENKFFIKKITGSLSHVKKIISFKLFDGKVLGRITISGRVFLILSFHLGMENFMIYMEI